MKVKYDEAEYTLDLDDIDVMQAKVIKVATGLTLSGLEDGLAEADPDALQALFWLMCVQSGLQQDIAHTNFKVVRFAKALNEASAAEREAEDARKKDEAAKAKAAGRRPVRDSSPKE